MAVSKNELIEQAQAVFELATNGTIDFISSEISEQISTFANNVAEFLDNLGEKRGKDLESGRCGQLLNILRENKKGISKQEILNQMDINKGNLASLIVYLRKGGIEVLRIGDKLILAEYVKIGTE